MNLDWSVLAPHADRFLDGALMTVFLTVATMALAMPGGLVLAFLRLSPWSPVRRVTTGFVEFFRATPLILQIYWVYYVLPAFFDIRFEPLTTAIIGLTCNISSFNSETFRAGIVSIRQGQWNAGLALGMTRLEVMRRVVLPQATLRMVPPMASMWVSLFKDTSVLSAIGVAELMFQARYVATQTYRPLEVFTAVAVVYFLITYPQSIGVNALYRRFRTQE